MRQKGPRVMVFETLCLFILSTTLPNASTSAPTVYFLSIYFPFKKPWQINKRVGVQRQQDNRNQQNNFLMYSTGKIHLNKLSQLNDPNLGHWRRMLALSTQRGTVLFVRNIPIPFWDLAYSHVYALS